MRKIAVCRRELHSRRARQFLLTMKLTSLLLLVACMQVVAKSHAQEKITLQLRNAGITQVLKAVEKQTDYRFVYHNESLASVPQVTVSANAATLDEVLRQAFAGTTLTYALKENGLVVLYTNTSAAQDHTIRGKVTGADNLPLPGVTVRATGTHAGAMTDANGNYTLTLPEGATSLEFTLVGYTKQQHVIGGRSLLDVHLEVDVQTLNSVTVTGYTNYTRNKSVSAAAVVGADKIAEVPMATFDNILQARVPGLVVTSGSGQPGTSANVVLRGIGTLAGNSRLLYVLDGVPIEPDYLQAINSNDIESVTVLKDAASTALYGSRGANGVLVITTRKGKAGKVALEYRSQYGFSELPTAHYGMMDTKERLEFEHQVGVEQGQTLGAGWEYARDNPDNANLSPDELALLDHKLDSVSHINTDWRKVLLQKGRFSQQQLALTGGSDNVRFYTSLDYFKQDGIVKRSGLERYTFKHNMDINLDRFTGSVNLTVGYARSRYISREGSSKVINPVASTFYALPYESPYAPDGTLITSDIATDYGAIGDREGSNALDAILNATNTEGQLKGLLSGNFNYRIAKGLVAKTRLGIDYRDIVSESYVNPDSHIGRSVDKGGQGSYGEGLSRNTALISTSGLTYSNIFAQKHDLEVSAYFEYNQRRLHSFNYTGYGLDDRLPYSAGAITPGTPDNSFIPDVSGARSAYGLVSYMALGRYTLNEKYTVNASLRYDGSSTVPVAQRWHPFYSVGLGWEAKKEEWFKDITAISDLRFRASYGTVASPFGSPYGYFAAFGTTSYGGIPAQVPVSPGYPQYDWEYARELNIGFDLGLFNNRLRLVTDVYNKKTYNLFVEQPLSLTSGFETLLLNVGAMRNRGIEADLQGEVVRTRDLTWRVGVNVSYNKNVITDLGNTGEFLYGNNETVLIRKGLPFGTQYAPKWAGVDPETGRGQFYTHDGKITTEYDDVNQNFTLGSYIPALTGGFNTSVTWKGLYGSALFAFTGHTMRYNNEDYYNENEKYNTSNQTRRELYDRWRKPGDKAILPSLDYSRHYSSLDVQEARYLRLRNVSIGYHLPKTVLNKWAHGFIKDVNIYVQGQNLVTWTKWKGFDPENSDNEALFAYPNPKTYTAGLNLNF